MIWRCENDFNKRQILPPLTKNRIVEGVQGKGGGYRLVRTPEEYTIGDILRITERDLAPVSCLAEGAIKKAVKDYYDHNGIEYDPSIFPPNHDCEYSANILCKGHFQGNLEMSFL